MFKAGAKSKSVSADRDGSRDPILKPRRPMIKQPHLAQTMVFCGVDVSAATLAVPVHSTHKK